MPSRRCGRAQRLPEQLRRDPAMSVASSELSADTVEASHLPPPSEQPALGAASLRELAKCARGPALLVLLHGALSLVGRLSCT